MTYRIDICFLVVEKKRSPGLLFVESGRLFTPEVVLLSQDGNITVVVGIFYIFTYLYRHKVFFEISDLSDCLNIYERCYKSR